MFILSKSSNKKGFTLIELILVIVLLGILATVVFANFIDISGDAKRNSFSSVLGSLKSANITNKSAQLGLSKGVPIPTSMSCLTAANALMDGGMPDNYIVWPISWPMGGSPGQDRTCYLIVTDPIQWDAFTITTTE